MTAPDVAAPTFDADGYPTEATLRRIRRWPMTDFADARRMLAFVHQAWWHPEMFVGARRRHRNYRSGHLKRRWTFSTGGWSGNESLVAAMEANRTFWMLCWVSTTRGGHFVIEVPER